MKILLFFYVLSLSYLQAQNTLISGKVFIDEDESMELEGIEITNLSSNARTKTNPKGIFSIKVNENDELLFKGEFIEERKIRISPLTLQKGFISVHLNIKVIELAETNVNTLNKFWQKNVKLKYDFIDSLYINLGLDPSIRFKDIPLNLRSMGTNISRKQAKQNLKYFNKIKVLEKIENYYSKYYFTTTLKIPENKIDEFLLFSDSNNNFEEIIKQNDFELIEEMLSRDSSTYLDKINAKIKVNE